MIGNLSVVVVIVAVVFIFVFVMVAVVVVGLVIVVVVASFSAALMGACDACVAGGYVTLVNDYIKNYLVFCVKFEILPDITYNTTSQGVVDNLADFTSPVDPSKLNYLRQETFKKAETYKKKMEKYLDDNITLYPEWKGCDGCDNKTKGGNVSKRHGIITY